MVISWLNSFIAYSTRLGVAWWYINFIFRAVVSAGLAKNLYADALKEMSCDTKLPGCKECCHAIFQPIDPDRFWALEAVFVASPSILFLLYVK